MLINQRKFPIIKTVKFDYFPIAIHRAPSKKKVSVKKWSRQNSTGLTFGLKFGLVLNFGLSSYFGLTLNMAFSKLVEQNLQIALFLH